MTHEIPTFDCVYDGGKGSGKAIWHQKGCLYTHSTKPGALEPISGESLERNGFTPSETAKILTKIYLGGNIDQGTFKRCSAILNTWFPERGCDLSAPALPLPGDVLTDWKP